MRPRDLIDAPAGAFLHCAECGGEYSATADDYFFLPVNHEFMCCEQPLQLVTAERVITIIK